VRSALSRLFGILFLAVSSTDTALAEGLGLAEPTSLTSPRDPGGGDFGRWSLSIYWHRKYADPFGMPTAAESRNYLLKCFWLLVVTAGGVSLV